MGSRIKMWQTDAPSNIALIKYMGKKDFKLNIPTNASLSYTLPHLKTTVKLTESTHDHWKPLDGKQYITESGQIRFMNYLNKIKQHYQYDGGFCIESANNFPTGAGIASSASSFAALTKVASITLSELTKKPELSVDEQAKLSRTGSGSSIRSFYEPWALWQDDHCHKIDLGYDDLIHQVVIIESVPKKVSSTDAHKLIETSPIFESRQAEIQFRLDNLITAFKQKDWFATYQIVRDEFLEMHELFHTCNKPFSYMQPASKKITEEVETIWKDNNDGPLITMDAGPNVHLLFRQDQVELANQTKARYSEFFDVYTA